ncbi:MAG: hypothetical protein MR765_03070 [Tenericutes bacterium]|nr:hypothetical protein [Mycoplasmatota bacterium]
MEEEKFEIHIKGGFSERKKLKSFSDIVQTNNLNERTRNKLFSIIRDIIVELSSCVDGCLDVLIEYIYEELFSLTKAHIPLNYSKIHYDYDKVIDILYDIYSNYEYNEVFDFIEGLIKAVNSVDQINPYIYKYEFQVVARCNKTFIEENVNYRIVNNIITDLVSENEIKEIDNVINNKNKVVSNHVEKALELLYQSKDYDNSIKESISAVEGMCQILTGNDNATLGDCLKKLKESIHPAMKDAFLKLYGYTSDANGIRHANGLGEGDSTFAEAKYMLVSCSSFINYLSESIKKDD